MSKIIQIRNEKETDYEKVEEITDRKSTRLNSSH